MNRKFFLSMLTLMMVAMFSFTFISCGDDDDDVNVTASELVGTWEGEIYDDGDVEKNVIKLEANYTGESKSYHNGYLYQSFTFEWTLNGNKIHVTPTSSAYIDFYDFTIVSFSSSKMVLNNGEMSLTFTRTNK